MISGLAGQCLGNHRIVADVVGYVVGGERHQAGFPPVASGLLSRLQAHERAAIQASDEPAPVLAARFGTTGQTVYICGRLSRCKVSVEPI